MKSHAVFGNNTIIYLGLVKRESRPAHVGLAAQPRKTGKRGRVRTPSHQLTVTDSNCQT